LASSRRSGMMGRSRKKSLPSFASLADLALADGPFLLRKSGNPATPQKEVAMPDWMREFLNTARADGTRTSALAPLQWMAAICFSGCVGLAYATHSVWLVAAALVMPFGICVFYCVAYWQHLKTNPDALRSERYSLSKLAIEKGLVGDDLKGLVAPQTVEAEPEEEDEPLPQLGHTPEAKAQEGAS
jgi:hypothetical protein